MNSNMFINKISIQGYRGRNFTLEIQENQPYTIFQMDGNTGKTTTIELLRWCFSYKCSEAKGKFKHMWTNPAHVLDWKKEGHQECRIDIHFSDDEENYYKFSRITKGTFDTTKTDEKEKGDQIEAIEDDLDINHGADLKKNDEVFKYLSSKLDIADSSQFCFFDGERAREFLRIAARDVKDLINIIEKRVTHNKIKRYLKELDILYQKIVNDAAGRLTDRAQKRADTSLHKYNRKLTEVKNKKRKNKEKIRTNERARQSLEERNEEITEKIDGEKSNQLIQRIRLENEIKSNLNNIDEKRAEIFTNYKTLVDIHKLIPKINNIKSLIKEKGKLPEPYRGELIKDCLEHNPPRCLFCGRDLDQKSSKYIEKHQDTIASKAVQEFLINEIKIDDPGGYDFSVARNDIKRYYGENQEIKKEIDKLELTEVELNLLKEMEDNKDIIKSISWKIGKLEEENSQLEKKEEELKQKIKTNVERLDDLENKKPLLEYVEKTAQLLEETQDNMKEKTISVISRVLNTAVKNILGNKFGARLDQERGLLLCEDGICNDEIGGYSGRLILSYLFAEAMNNIRAIVIDSPVGNIGSHRPKLAKHLMKNHSQIVLLCLPTELERFAEFFNVEPIIIENQED